MIRNVLLVALCFIGVVGTVVAGSTPLTAPGAALALSGAAVGVLIVVRLDDIISLIEK